MPSRFGLPGGPEPAELGSEIDKSKRYDLYCRTDNKATIVYRNVLFKGLRSLCPRNDHDYIGSLGIEVGASKRRNNLY